MKLNEVKSKRVTWSRDLECFYYIIYWRRWSWRTWSFRWQVAETGLAFMGMYSVWFARPSWLRRTGRGDGYERVTKRHTDWKRERLIRSAARIGRQHEKRMVLEH